MASKSSNTEENKRVVRIWMDGCFDLVHCGHADAFRQAKALGDYLIVGIHSDAVIREYKGSPVSNEQERYKLVRAIKWVDEVVENAPLDPTLETLDTYNCAFCVHGEDLSLGTDGTDYHQPVKIAGRYKDLNRTLKISTTDLIRRMLLTTNTNEGIDHTLKNTDSTQYESSKLSFTHLTNEEQSTMMNKIISFSNVCQLSSSDCIIYAPGVYDLFHCGHVDFLEKAKAMGNYLIVGVYTDHDINRFNANRNLIMSTNERALSLLACRFVDEVVIGAPYFITMDLIDRFKIDWVVHGQTNYRLDEDGQDPYEVPKRLNKFKLIDSENSIITADIIDRVSQNRLEYEARNAKKLADELEGLKSFASKLKQ